jgi:hypothetical protein
MPSWDELLEKLEHASNSSVQAREWFHSNQVEWLGRLSAKRGGRNVIFYASGFLQKPQAPASSVQISGEDINGFMAVLKGMDWSKHLTLLLHTPGGVTNATETIVEYLLQKFTDIEVIIPTYAMSAGTMVSLAANRLVMGRQSQLGPIDPQMPVGGRFVSARAVVDQFEQAKDEILENPALAAVWAPALQSLGPALLVEAKYALDYGEKMVTRWLSQRRFKGDSTKAAEVAGYFNRSAKHTSHGRRIDRAEAHSQNLAVEELEADPELQEIVLTNYHLATLLFEKSPASKFIVNHRGKIWIKNLQLAKP